MYSFRYLKLAIAICVVILTHFEVQASTPVDEFEYTGPAFAMSRLDSFLNYLHNNPTYGGNVIVYGARYGKVGELQAHLSQIKEYLVRYRKYDPERLTIQNGGYREKVSIEVWGIPPGADLQKPSPHFQAADVKLKGKFRSKALYKCC